MSKLPTCQDPSAPGCTQSISHQVASLYCNDPAFFVCQQHVERYVKANEANFQSLEPFHIELVTSRQLLLRLRDILREHLREHWRLKYGCDYSWTYKYGELHLLCGDIFLDTIVVQAGVLGIRFATTHVYPVK